MVNRTFTRQVILSKELDEQLQKAMKSEGRTFSNMIRVMVSYYLMEESDRERFKLGNTGRQK